jgi:1-Cys peroxiredoxin 6
MSHPKDFTPVCTTELGKANLLHEEFLKRGAKLIAVSCDSLDSHYSWSEDITYREKSQSNRLSYPTIADENRSIVTRLGMLDPREKNTDGTPLPARALIVFDFDYTVRLAMLYPGSTGRNFDEILGAIDSLNVVEKYPVATPVNWHTGEKVLVPARVSDEEAHSKLSNVHTESLPSGRGYLRYATVRE